ncbi:glycoside hydrolase family 76 protein [Aestuariivivens insulae]|uniref:glycoside hydrolase family 76 protein n=1 Tax=Aestuariivivens insulae TaxID=1621988 RepID=UPI001F59026F|nr:glycoside hydrolase family 76 protein [Aestuariivivens insulae]
MKRRKFVKATGSYSILLAAAGALTACGASTNGKDEDKELLEQSIKAFKRFSEVWDFQDFWKRGNTFDACLVFVSAMVQRWPDNDEVNVIQDQVRNMLEENLSFFASYDPGTLWADDFGWWGLMGLNARKHLLNMGDKELADKYLKLSVDLCWEYKKKTAYDHSETGNPVPHGCRNGDANGDSKGVKNTVTNVLLFLLSSRIYRLTLTEGMEDNDKYLEMAYKQWKWFDQWFKLKEYEYLKEISASAAMVQERPMAFFEGSDYQEKIHPPWAEGWVWSGDQGMLIAALTDMYGLSSHLGSYIGRNRLDPEFNEMDFRARINSIIQKLGNGVKKALVGNSDHIIREAPCLSSFGPQHGNDYVAGRGILLRYISADEERKMTGIDWNLPIQKTLEAVWNTRDISNNQFSAEFTTVDADKKYIEQFRELWGLADNVHTWDLDKMQEKNRLGVCQAIGLDILGAAIKMK